MSKKKHAAEHVNHERWLVSYADFITLLFAFFVVLFSSSQVDRSKTKKMALAIESAFERFAIFKFQGGDSMEESGGGSGGNAKKYREYLLQDESGKPIVLPPEISDEQIALEPPKSNPELDQNTGMITSQEEAMERAHKDLMGMLEQKKIDGAIEIIKDYRGIVISLKEAVLFEAGADKLIPKSYDTLKNIAGILSRVPNQVRIEGHTDDKSNSGDVSSNWDLSVARASHVIKWLVDNYKLKPERFIAVGYGQFRPAFDNSTEEGRQKNRRIDIVILSADAAKKEAALPDYRKLKQPNPMYAQKQAARGVPLFRVNEHEEAERRRNEESAEKIKAFQMWFEGGQPLPSLFKPQRTDG